MTMQDGAAQDVQPSTYYSAEDLELDLRWWAAANYLTAAQIYLRDEPPAARAAAARHIKPRLLGHWGTSPGLTMLHALLNRLIRRTGSELPLVTGPGHGGPAVLAGAYLDGTYSEVLPGVSRDLAGLTRLVRQFSTPGGVSSHAGVHIPGSIHEGGELGYALLHAAGAAFDDPDLIVACVIGDGEAETGPLAASWRLPAFLNARRDGAVLPVLHVNGHKISGPTLLGRSSDDDLRAFLRSQGWAPGGRLRRRPGAGVPDLDAALTARARRIREIQSAARGGAGPRPAAGWPAIVLRTPKGWTGPARGRRRPGRGHLPRAPGAAGQVRDNPEHLAQL